MLNSIKNFIKGKPPQNAGEFSQKALESALLRGMPYYLTIPATPLLGLNHPAAIGAFILITLAETEYLRSAQNSMKHKFNDYADGLSWRDKSKVRPILNSLNARPDSELTLSKNDLNPLERPLASVFGVAAGLISHDPLMGVAAYTGTIATAEMVHLLKPKLHSLAVKIKQDLSSPNP